jgi:hypothetical protein
MAQDRAPDDHPETPERPLATREATYPMSRLAPRFDLVDIASEIQRADETLSMVASAKLDQIRDQIKALQDQARAILEETQRAAELHRARCNFKKVPGRVYHLYRRGEGERYFSMLSPDDWHGSPPHPYEGSYRLEIDQSFTKVGEVNG